MDPNRNKLIVRDYAEAFSRGDLDAVCRCFAPDAVVYGVLGWGELAKAKPIWESLMRSFRIRLRIESMIAEGDTVAVRYTESGEFVAEFRGTAPTGRKYELLAMEWFEVGEQGIRRRWGARDSAAMFRQLGIPLS